MGGQNNTPTSCAPCKSQSTQGEWIDASVAVFVVIVRDQLACVAPGKSSQGLGDKVPGGGAIVLLVFCFVGLWSQMCGDSLLRLVAW